MIAKLTGILIAIGTDNLIIDVNGIGYRLLVSQRTIRNLPELNHPLECWTETIIRNEQAILCGFLSQDESTWFQTLNQVQGVGAKVALAILSQLGTEEIYQAVVEQQPAIIAKADGVGPKLANRIILELKDKRSLPTPSLTSTQTLIHTNPARSDTISALTNLGYNRNEAEKAVEKALGKTEKHDIASLLPISLKELQYG